jgi:hypothetical protein
MEMRKAYNEGRSEKDPATFWYNGEIGFFDYYIIPLAKKLSECGVFGVSSDEYLNYAIQNRNEWEKKGKAIVEEYMIASINSGSTKQDKDVKVVTCSDVSEDSQALKVKY